MGSVGMKGMKGSEEHEEYEGYEGCEELGHPESTAPTAEISRVIGRCFYGDYGVRLW